MKFAATPLGLQTLLNSLDRALGLVGLEISVGPNGKSASLRIDIDGKAKRWVVNPHPFLEVTRLPEDAGLIPASSITQSQKYLGVEIFVGAIRAKAANKLQRGLSHLSAAPLKPQQRLYILKHHLMPALYHGLVLTPCPDRYMNWLDRSIRAALRSWLKMPKDTPTAYFHAEIVDGGLGVDMLSQTVPLMRSERLGRLGLSDDPAILAMLEYVAARPGMQRHLHAKTYGDSIINTREALHAALAGQLHRSVDGRGLTPSATVPDQHGWIQDPPNTTETKCD